MRQRTLRLFPVCYLARRKPIASLLNRLVICFISPLKMSSITNNVLMKSHSSEKQTNVLISQEMLRKNKTRRTLKFSPSSQRLTEILINTHYLKQNFESMQNSPEKYIQIIFYCFRLRKLVLNF